LILAQGDQQALNLAGGLFWDYPDPHILRTQAQAAGIDGLHHTNNAGSM
jgi:hypothetical protein